MSVTKRLDKNGKNRWLVRVEQPDPLTGKRRRVTVGTFPTKREAELAEAKAITARERGSLIEPDTATVAELLDTWMASKAADVTAQTTAGYAIIIRVHLKPAFGTVRVQKLTAARVQALYGEWRDAGMSGRTMRECHLVLSQALGQAARFGVVQSNICHVVTSPRRERSTPAVWSSHEAMTFIDVAQHDRLSVLWHLLLLEGMRRGEALGLRWQDINWNRGTAHISQSVRAGIAKGEAIIQSRTKTSAGTRTVRLTSRTLAVLKEHRKQWLERKLAAETWADHDLIICTGKGTPVNPGNVRKHFDAVVRRAGLRRITPHGLRHTHATMLLKQGVPAKIVSERLGHASIGITLDTYSHVLPDMQDTAAAAMDTIMNGLREQA
ncbi:MAG: tyrosine-type recombinase/integrase [Thermomicrobiales bacterium]